MKPSLCLVLAVLVCSCASQDTGTAVVSMEKPATPPKPRTLSEARQQYELRKSNSVALAQTPGPMANYDENLRRQIDKRWRELIAQSPYPPRAGTVVVEFKINSAGNVFEARVAQNEVGELGGLCLKAIAETAPYGLWPLEMRVKIRSGYRDVRFTFRY